MIPQVSQRFGVTLHVLDQFGQKLGLVALAVQTTRGFRNGRSKALQFLLTSLGLFLVILLIGFQFLNPGLHLLYLLRQGGDQGFQFGELIFAVLGLRLNSIFLGIEGLDLGFQNMGTAFQRIAIGLALILLLAHFLKSSILFLHSMIGLLQTDGHLSNRSRCFVQMLRTGGPLILEVFQSGFLFFLLFPVVGFLLLQGLDFVQ